MAALVDSDEEEFEDAIEEVIAPEMDMNLKESIEDAFVALSLFMNNKFTAARDRMKPRAGNSIYHTLAYSVIASIQAFMTFDQRDIEAAMKALKQSLEVCHRRRKKTSVTDSLNKMMRRQNYNNYTEEEVHAELCYAECLLFRALLTFIQDENFISFVKGGLKIRACYQSYKECYYMLENRTWTDPELKVHFESGVLMGVGTFNLLISSLPAKLLRLLEFVGFSGNKELGLRKLEEARISNGLRGQTCSLILLCYHTIITYVIGQVTGDLDYADSVLKPMLIDYPQGTLVLFFAGRLEEVKGNLDTALERLKDSVDSQHEWRQFHHLCYWELMWCHAFQRQWREAWHFADKLYTESRWSRVIYGYQKGALMCMAQETLSPEEKDELNELMRTLPKYKQRIAGKSIPLEKFALKKTQQYIDQNNSLVLPVLELMFLWNSFNIVGKKLEYVHPFLTLTEKVMEDMRQEKDRMKVGDNYCRALLLKGMCLRYLNSPLQAEQCYREVVKRENEIKEDTYLVPNAIAELGLLMMDNGNFETAERVLETARTNYKGYSLESRLHFKIHNALADLKKRSKETTVDTDKYNGHSGNKACNVGIKATPVEAPLAETRV